MISLINHDSQWGGSVRLYNLPRCLKPPNKSTVDGSHFWHGRSPRSSNTAAKKSYDVSRASCDLRGFPSDVWQRLHQWQPSFEDLLGISWVPKDADIVSPKIFTQMPMKSRSRPAWAERPSAPEAAAIFHRWDDATRFAKIKISSAINGLVTENVGLIFPMIASHLKTGLSDQQNHWLQWGTRHFQTHPNVTNQWNVRNQFGQVTRHAAQRDTVHDFSPLLKCPVARSLESLWR